MKLRNICKYKQNFRERETKKKEKQKAVQNSSWNKLGESLSEKIDRSFSKIPKPVRKKSCMDRPN